MHKKSNKNNQSANFKDNKVKTEDTSKHTNKYDPVDVYVGRRVKERRASLGISQNDLAYKLGISSQQVQKYEKGLNRIGSSRLHSIANILQVQISYFFEHYENLSSAAGIYSEDKVLQKYVHKTTKLFESIVDENLRKKIFLGAKNVVDSIMAVVNSFKFDDDDNDWFTDDFEDYKDDQSKENDKNNPTNRK